MNERRGFIKYSELADLSLQDAISRIRGVEGIRFGDLKVADLLLNGAIADMKLSDHIEPNCYGRGAYVFFDGQSPIYVGKADNFLSRLVGHRNTDPQLFWGFNALLKKVATVQLKAGHSYTKEKLMEALKIADGFDLVRVLLDRKDTGEKLHRFERTIMKGMKYQSKTLLNDGIPFVDDKFMRQSFQEIMQ